MSRWALSGLLFGLFTGAVTTGMTAEPTNSWQVGDDILTLRLTRSTDGGIVETCRVRGVDMPYQGAPGSRAGRLDRSGRSCAPRRPRRAAGACTCREKPPASCGVFRYERTGPGMVTKSLVLESRADVLLQRVAPAVFAADPAPAIASTQSAGYRRIHSQRRQGPVSFAGFPLLAHHDGKRPCTGCLSGL